MGSSHMRRIGRFCWPVILATMGSPALAAPFCLQSQSIPPQCIYFDAHQCQTDAARQGGTCTVNNQQLALNPGIGQYCMVTSDGVSMCNYADLATCNREAARQNAACTEAPTVAPAGTPNPYSPVGGL